MERILSPINDRSPRQAAELRKTLLCYLENKYNMQRTATALGLHINTIRQRLESLRQILGDWDDPIRALEIHIALRLASLVESDQ